MTHIFLVDVYCLVVVVLNNGRPKKILLLHLYFFWHNPCTVGTFPTCSHVDAVLITCLWFGFVHCGVYQWVLEQTISAQKSSTLCSSINHQLLIWSCDNACVLSRKKGNIFFPTWNLNLSLQVSCYEETISFHQCSRS